MKSGAEIRAQLDETNDSVNLLQKELGDELNRVRKTKGKVAPFDWRAWQTFVSRWSTFYEDSCNSVVALNHGGTFDTAAEYLKDCHVWRKRAVKDGALPSTKGSDPYSEPPDDPSGVDGLVKGAMIVAGLYLVARILGKV
jgi:hypothetical protein